MAELEKCVKCPLYSDLVYKDECMYCFDNMVGIYNQKNVKFQTFEGGIYICLKTWTCLCQRHIERMRNIKDCLYLNIIGKKKEKVVFLKA